MIIMQIKYFSYKKKKNRLSDLILVTSYFYKTATQLKIAKNQSAWFSITWYTIESTKNCKNLEKSQIKKIIYIQKTRKSLKI